LINEVVKSPNVIMPVETGIHVLIFLDSRLEIAGMTTLLVFCHFAKLSLSLF